MPYYLIRRTLTSYVISSLRLSSTVLHSDFDTKNKSNILQTTLVLISLVGMIVLVVPPCDKILKVKQLMQFSNALVVQRLIMNNNFVSLPVIGSIRKGRETNLLRDHSVSKGKCNRRTSYALHF